MFVFDKEQRVAQTKYRYDTHTILLLETKNTGQLGIITSTYLDQNIRITSLERTLIDIAVRPLYKTYTKLYIVVCFVLRSVRHSIAILFV